MKFLSTLLVLAFVSPGMMAQTNPKTHRVKPHVKKDGTYVPPSTRTSPNKTEKDNFGAKGNTNPYTGKKGTKIPKK